MPQKCTLEVCGKSGLYRWYTWYLPVCLFILPTPPPFYSTQIRTHTHTVPLSVTIDPQQKVVNVSDSAELTCTAHAYPLPTIVWAREDSTGLQLRDGIILEPEGLLGSVL